MIKVVIKGVEHRIWSRLYEKCVECGTTKRRHVAKGLCERCRHRLAASAWRKKQKKEAGAGVTTPSQL